MKGHYQILIIGGGTAGITVAAQLLRKNQQLDVGIIEPSDKHYYQPGWTFVGAGLSKVDETVRSEADCIPRNAAWIQDSAEQFDPENNAVVTGSNGRITYDFLVVCPGAKLNWHMIKGLPDAFGKNGVCTNYLPEIAPYTFECIRNLQGGKAIFIQPGGPNKCGGAPQKIMYLAADSFRRRGMSGKVDISFYTGKDNLLRVKEIHETLLKVVKRYGIRVQYRSTLKEISGEKKEAVIEIAQDEGKELVTVPFDMIHVVPSPSAPDVIRNSKLSVKDDPNGWVDVNRDTLQHNRYQNIFSLGDVANAGDTKTAAAIRKQAPVVVENLISSLKRQPDPVFVKYNGYTS